VSIDAVNAIDFVGPGYLQAPQIDMPVADMRDLFGKLEPGIRLMALLQTSGKLFLAPAQLAFSRRQQSNVADERDETQDPAGLIEIWNIIREGITGRAIRPWRRSHEVLPFSVESGCDQGMILLERLRAEKGRKCDADPYRAGVVHVTTDEIVIPI
jgi:hypothetical protein